MNIGNTLFNVFLADLYFIINDIDIKSCADDNTLDIIAANIDNLIRSLEKDSTALFQWFDNNLFKSNPDKCHLLISSNENVTVHFGKCEIGNSMCKT